MNAPSPSSTPRFPVKPIAIVVIVAVLAFVAFHFLGGKPENKAPEAAPDRTARSAPPRANWTA